VPLLCLLKGRRMFETVLSIIISLALWLECFFGTRHRQSRLSVLALVVCLAGLLPFLRDLCAAHRETATVFDPGFGVLWLLGAACAVAAALPPKYPRLAALVMVSGAGLVSCISFVWLSAPDLALTQLLVETVTTLLLLLGLRWLPERLPEVLPESRTP